jgi:hypothetical protein
MKTAKNTKTSFPTPTRFSAYVLAVAVFCFFNWVALRTSNTDQVESNVNQTNEIAFLNAMGLDTEFEGLTASFEEAYLAGIAE